MILKKRKILEDYTYLTLGRPVLHTDLSILVPPSHPVQRDDFFQCYDDLTLFRKIFSNCSKNL